MVIFILFQPTFFSVSGVVLLHSDLWMRFSKNIPFAPFIGKNVYLWKTTHDFMWLAVVTHKLNEVLIHTLQWPVCSSALNPIEHLGDNLKWRIQSRYPVPITSRNLKKVELEKWNNIPSRRSWMKYLIDYKKLLRLEGIILTIK